jgi:C4-dicarboxylate-specific signal transduction histidine kinase
MLSAGSIAKHYLPPPCRGLVETLARTGFAPVLGCNVSRMSRISGVLTLVGCLGVVALIGIADSLTGYEIRLAILYLGPIVAAAWLLGTRAGIGIAAAAMSCWFITFESNHPYTSALYFYWEGAIITTTYLMIAVLAARLRRALERSDERFVTVLERLDAAVAVEDAQSNALLYANRRWRETFAAGPPAFREAGETWDGATQRWYLVQPRPLRWIDGREALLRVWSDVTEVRRARELMQRHREAAHRTARLVALGEFASAIAHELNQPLAAIATYNNACLMLLEKGERGSSELDEAMRKCRDQARRAGAIIQRLREVLRQPVPSREPQDLNEVARAAAALADVQANEAGVRLELDLADGLPKVSADGLLVEQVAVNLLRNAIEAVQHLAPERRRVRVATAAGRDGVTLSVCDLGPGVPAEVSARLFEAFVTTKPSGLGLGLSICRSVIESLGGTIRSLPAAGAGAHFAFTLPAEAA